MNDIEIQYQVHDLDEVMRYFSEGFKPKNGDKILRCECFIDIHLRKAVFRITIEREINTATL